MFGLLGGCAAETNPAFFRLGYGVRDHHEDMAAKFIVRRVRLGKGTLRQETRCGSAVAT